MALERTLSEGGSQAVLFPKGCQTIEDLPADFSLALAHAHMVNTWYSNCSTEEMPPQWMWPFESEISQWFDEVKLARESGSGGEDADNQNMVVNEYAKDIRG